MITDSSKDYGRNIILIHYEDQEPSAEDLRGYIAKNYGNAGFTILSKEAPSESHGLKNPGTIMVRQIWI